MVYQHSHNSSERMARIIPSQTLVSFGRLMQVIAPCAILTLLIAMFLPFLSGLLWAVLLAIAFWPLHIRFVHRIPKAHKGSRVAFTALMTLLILCMIILPICYIAFTLVGEGNLIISWIRELRKEPSFFQGLSRVPFIGTELKLAMQHLLVRKESLIDMINQFDNSLVFNVTKRFGIQLIDRATTFFVMALTLFFLLRDGEELSKRFKILALGVFGEHGDLLCAQVVSVVRGTINGLVLVGIGVGLLLGCVYYSLGLPNTLSLTLLTILSALIPFGCPIMVLIISLILALTGSFTGALVLGVVGVVVTFCADHFIRPVLIGGTNSLPFLWVLLGILGGFERFGLLGLFLGPVLVALLMMFWNIATDQSKARQLTIRTQRDKNLKSTP